MILCVQALYIIILTPLRPFYQLKVAHRRLLPLGRYYAGCFRNNKQPLADVLVPEGGCASGNEAIRYAGFITFT